MARTVEGKAKLVQKTRRIRGQVEAIERALEAEQRCGAVLRLIAAAKGGIDSLMAEVLEGYICPQLLDANHRRPSGRAQAERELRELMRSFLQ